MICFKTIQWSPFDPKPFTDKVNEFLQGEAIQKEDLIDIKEQVIYNDQGFISGAFAFITYNKKESSNEN